jgi:hypothetical protein
LYSCRRRSFSFFWPAVAPRVLSPRRACLRRRWLRRWWSAPARAGSSTLATASMARLPARGCGRLGRSGVHPVRRSCSRHLSCRAVGLLFLRLGKEASFGGCFFAGSVRVPEGAPESFVRFPYFCEREGFCDGIPDGGVGDGWWVVGSSALRPAAPDLCSTLALRKMAADRRSSSKLRLGVVPGRRFVRLQ